MTILDKFRRTTNNKRFIPEIDGFRFFAIITVVLFHFNTALRRTLGDRYEYSFDHFDMTSFGWWIWRGDIGVKVFFAISGFILALPFLKQYLKGENKVKLGDYFYRRLTRLEPPFIVSLIFFFFVHLFIMNESLAILLPNFVASFFYAHCFVYGEPSIINPVTWSLETEAQFYIVIPFLLMLIFRVFGKSKISLMGSLIIIILFSLYCRNWIYSNGISNLSYSILIYLLNFIVGVVVAYCYLMKESFFKSKIWYWDIIGAIAFFSLYFFYKPQFSWSNHLIFNISVFVMFISVFKGVLFNWFFTRPIIYTIGGMCYTIYLLHYAFLYAIVPYTSKFLIGSDYVSNYWFQFIIVVPILMIICSVFYLMFERPCMDKNWPVKLYNSVINKFVKR